MEKESKIEVGERCWHYFDGCFSFVDVTKAADFCVGQDIEFRMYEVKSCVSGHLNTSAHRSNLFRCPSERPKLIARLKSNLRQTEYFLGELRAQEDDYVPDPEKDDV